MPYLELPLMSKMPDISKLPGLISSSTLALRRSLFGKPCKDVFVSSRRGIAASGTSLKKAPIQPVSRQTSTILQTVQQQAMSLKQGVLNWKPAPSSPLWEIAERLGSAYRSVQGQIRRQLNALPGYYERAAASVKNWWKGLWRSEKPLPSLPKEEMPVPVSVRSDSSKSMSRMEPLKHSDGQATGQGFDDLFEAVGEDINSCNSGGNVYEMSDLNLHPMSKEAPEPVLDSLGHDVDPVPVRRYRPESYTDESRTILDDLLADLKAGIYPPRRSRITPQVKRTWRPEAEMPSSRQSVPSDTDR